MRKLLGRIGEWCVTHPAPAIAGVASIVAIVGVVGALRLSPDAGTDKLVDNGSSAFEGTQEFRERFGDEAIVVLAQGDLKELVLTDNVQKLLALEGCLAGNPGLDGRYVAAVCEEIRDLGATRVVFGPATFLNEAATRTNDEIQRQVAALQESQDPAAIPRALQLLGGTGLGIGDILGGLSLSNTNFVSSIVFDSTQDGNPPKAKFGYLFPSEQGALMSIRLQPDISDDTRREAIGLIREAVGEEAFQIRGGSYAISGFPVLVEGLADAIGGQMLILFAAALAVMAIVLIAVFGPPLRLLPLFIALGAAGFAFGLLSLIGGTLTIASVAVLPVVIGLAVDYAIQLQARFREAAASGERPPAAAVIAAVRGGPVIGTAALATGAGFLVLVLSPIPMVQEFAIALVAGIFAALTISLTAGLAALSMTPGTVPRPSARLRDTASGGARLSAWGQRALATSIARPGRVLVAAFLLAAVGWAAGIGTRVVSDVRELVPADLPELEALNDLQDATGVSAELNVLIEGDVTAPESIAWMSTFGDRVLGEQGFSAAAPGCRAAGTRLCPGPGLADLFDLDNGELTTERIDAVLDAVPPYFSQAILSESGAAGDGEVASLSFLIPVMPLDEQKALIDEIRSELDPPPGITAELVGLSVLAADANAALSGSRYWLTLAGLLAVGLVLLLIYRSPSRALVPLLPIALATGWSALVIEAVGIPLNPMSATLGALVIAVATEFSVILSARYHEERAGGSSIGEALRFTYARTGKAVLASGITSIAGFGVLSFSGITMLRDFGLITIVDLTVALAGVMLVLPAALVWAEGGFRPLPALRGLRAAGPADSADARA